MCQHDVQLTDRQLAVALITCIDEIRECLDELEKVEPELTDIAFLGPLIEVDVPDVDEDDDSELPMLDDEGED